MCLSKILTIKCGYQNGSEYLIKEKQKKTETVYMYMHCVYLIIHYNKERETGTNRKYNIIIIN